MFSKVLCAVSLDPLADSIFELGLELSEKLGCELALVSIIDHSSLYTGDSGVSMDELRASIKLEIEQLFARLVQNKKTSHIIAKFSDEGDPKKLIVEIAADWNADLIIIASHGRHGLSRVLLGSVAESVVRTSRCPVLVVPTHHLK